MISRFKQRQLVLQALYMHDIHKGNIDKNILLQFDWHEYSEQKTKNDLDFAKELLTLILDNVQEIDQIYSLFLAKTLISDIEIMDRALLRMTVAEICLFRTDPKIVIDEAVKLSKKYSNDYSYKLINGILHSVMSEFKKGELEGS